MSGPKDGEPRARPSWDTELVARELLARLQDDGGPDGPRPGPSLDDLRLHLVHLEGAVLAGRPDAFAAYASWQRELHDSRGLPLDALRRAFRVLADIARARLVPVEAERVAWAVASAVEAVEAVAAPTGGPAPVPTVPSAGAHEAPSFAELLLAPDRRALEAAASSFLDAGGDYPTLAVERIQPALYRIGEWWQQGRISVADEHLATARAEAILARSLGTLEPAAPTGRRILLACAPGNHHVVGLRMVADVFELTGWDVRFLGADVPAEALLAMADEQRPDVLGVSVSMLPQLGAARSVLEGLRHELGPDAPHLVVGGLAPNTLPDVWRELGADAWGQDAVRAIAEIG